MTPKYINYTGPAYTGNVKTTIMFVTPEMATEFLERNRSNRYINRHTVRKYKRDMMAGDWSLNGETISFYVTGELKDGQHRLTAIKENNKGEWLIVVEGIPAETVIADRGRTRTTSNILEMAVYNPRQRGNATVGAINYLFTAFGNNNNVSDFERMRFIDDHSEAIELGYLASQEGKNPAIAKKAPVIAALICAAHCGVDSETLFRFGKVVNTGFSDGARESAAIVLRNRLLEPYGTDNKEKRDLFESTLSALEDFKNEKPRSFAYTRRTTTKWEKKAIADFFPEAKG